MSNKEEYHDSVPLLDVGDSAKVTIEVEGDDDDNWIYKDGFVEVNARRKVVLWGSDAAMLLLNHTQIYLMFFAMSLNLTNAWSYQYTDRSYYLFWLNLDVWNIWKIETKSWPTQDGYTPSNSVELDYRYITGGWLAALLALTACVIALNVLLTRISSSSILQQKAKLLQYTMFLVEALLLPYGLMAMRWFMCRQATLELDVNQDIPCFSQEHTIWASVSGVVLLVWLLVPYLLYRRIRQHIFTKITIEHEAFVLLKETEYVYGLDDGWLLSNYFLHSSFRRPWSYMRVYAFGLKYLLLLVYGLLYDWEQEQAFVFTFLFFTCLILLVIRRPYRVFSFNIMIFLSFFVNFCNAFISLCIELGTKSAMITDQYLKYEMILLNGGFYALSLLWVVYMWLRGAKCISPSTPLWPTITNTVTIKADIDSVTKRYLVAILRSRNLLKQTYSVPALLAPAHEISRRIKILNAYCREAMYLEHPVQHTMWDMTDELIQAHTAVYKKSIFSDSSSYGSKESAKQLYAMLPSFARRLHQRDEDLILMQTKRRRILLKMYCLSIFLSKHVDRVRNELADHEKDFDSDSDLGEEPEVYNYASQVNSAETMLKDESLLLMDSTLDDEEISAEDEGTTPDQVALGSSTSPEQDMDRDVSDLLKSSFFNKPPEVSTRQRTKRQSYVGLRASPALSTPRPNTTTPQNQQSTPNSSVLSFNAPLANSSFVEQFNLN